MAITAQEFKAVATAKMQKFTTEALKAELLKLRDELTTGANILTDVGLEILSERLDEQEFCDFCEQL